MMLVYQTTETGCVLLEVLCPKSSVKCSKGEWYSTSIRDDRSPGQLLFSQCTSDGNVMHQGSHRGVLSSVPKYGRFS